jgi:hypothetical protein
MKNLLTGLVLMVIAGCAQNYSGVMSAQSKIDNFQEGEVQAKAPGEPMLTQVDARILPAFASKEPVVLPETPGVSLPTLPAGAVLSARFVRENGDFVCSPDAMNTLPNKSGFVPYPMCLLITPEGNLKGYSFCHLPGSGFEIAEPVGIKFEKTTVYTVGSMKKEITYSGKSGNVIKLMYREYADDMARSALYQDLSYDLLESRLIVFKGLQVEIIEATNSGIRFKVVKRSTI